MKAKLILESGQELQVTYDEADLSQVNKSGRWTPAIGNRYFLITTSGEIDFTNNENVNYDKWCISQGNCFKTSKQANRYRQHLKDVATIRNSSDFVADWSDAVQIKYFIYYDLHNKTLRIDYVYAYQYPTFALYRTRLEAENALETYKDEYTCVYAYLRGEG